MKAQFEFHKWNFFDKKLKKCKLINSDEIVAYGTTLQAIFSLRADKVKDTLIKNICSHSLGILVYKGEKYYDDLFQIIKNGITIPFEIEKNFTTVIIIRRRYFFWFLNEKIITLHFWVEQTTFKSISLSF